MWTLLLPLVAAGVAVWAFATGAMTMGIVWAVIACLGLLGSLQKRSGRPESARVVVVAGALILSAATLIFAVSAVFDGDRRGLAMAILLAPVAALCWWALLSSRRTGADSETGVTERYEP